MDPKQQGEQQHQTGRQSDQSGQPVEQTRGSIQSQPSSQYWDQLSKEEQQSFGSREEFERQYPVSQKEGNTPT